LALNSVLDNKHRRNRKLEKTGQSSLAGKNNQLDILRCMQMNSKLMLRQIFQVDKEVCFLKHNNGQVRKAEIPNKH